MNKKHLLFVDKLIEHKFNQTKAYQETYPDCSYESARRLGSQLLLTNIDVKQALEVKIKEIDVDSLITKEYVLKKLHTEAETAKSASDRIRASELLGKYLTLFSDKVEHSGTIEHTQAETDEYYRLLKGISKELKSISADWMRQGGRGSRQGRGRGGTNPPHPLNKY